MRKLSDSTGSRRDRHDRSHRARRTGPAVLLGAVVLGAGVLGAGLFNTGASGTGARGAGTGAGPRTALVRRSCVASAARVDRLTAFGARVGRGIDCAVIFANAAPTWADLERPWFLHHPDRNLNWARWARAERGRRLVITQALVPDGVPADWRQRGARGEYDAHARGLARALVQAHLGHSVIRLAHEANGTWTKDGLGTTTADFGAWRAYWARFVRAMRSVPGARFTFDWTVNAGIRPLPFDAYYPGDRVVDVVGIDVYDFAVPGTAPADLDDRWNVQYRRRAGAAELLAFATRHDKPISIPEWGLAAPGHKGGVGDDPRFVDGIARIVRDRAVAYQSYFLSTTDVGMLLTDAPRSLAAYRRHFGAHGDATR